MASFASLKSQVFDREDRKQFIRTEEDEMDTSLEQRLVKRYYDKLFKEYCIADMSKYKTGKIGLRWRTEKEVMSGKVYLWQQALQRKRGVGML
ncbi:uncharacterized protein LOC141657607 isoform X2 [Silene latifolia]|uniref:uncharacterized protein LOC141657607 isoform X2 n=1 Tax=Silene latifolia TaxID=37657 RepID=UPI003D77DA65